MPVLTIIMPTKNRLLTAMSTTQCLAEIAGPDVEVLVQDASGDAQLGEWIVRSGLQQKVSYVHDAQAGSMSSNWNLAIKRVTGDYVCFIGDDDGADPRIVDLARWAARQRLSAVAFPHSSYIWKDFPSKHAGNLMLGTYGGRIEKVNGEDELKRTIGYTLHGIDRLAQSYHGLVANTLYQEMNRRTGTFFDALAPDYYSAVMLTALAGDALAYVDYPFTMHGGSRASNSGRSRSGGLNAHIREYGDFELSDLLPSGGENRSLSILFIAQSMLLAVQRLERSDLIADFDLATVYGAAIATKPIGFVPLAVKLAQASRRLGREPYRDIGALPLGTARAAFILAKSILIHALPSQALASRGFQLVPAADIVEAIHLQSEALRSLKVALD